MSEFAGREFTGERVIPGEVNDDLFLKRTGAGASHLGPASPNFRLGHSRQKTPAARLGHRTRAF